MMNRALLRQHDSGFVPEKGYMGYRFLLPHGIVSLCMNVVPSLRQRTGNILDNKDRRLKTEYQINDLWIIRTEEHVF